ncbi:MAG: tandem-95 repeat protein, partial [Polaromonas sp.]|nr:tandem-95 repeat protein [Polaromonas sp.]
MNALLEAVLISRGFADGGGLKGEGLAGHAVVDAVIDTGDERLVSTTAHTLAAQSAQTRTTLAAGDARLRTGSITGAGAGAFTPLGAAGLGAQVREAQEAMARSADAGSLTPLLALAVGAAVQWPALASAAALPPATQPDAETADWAVWDGSPASTAFNTASSSAFNPAFTQTPNPANFGGPAQATQADTSSGSQAGESYASNMPPAQEGHGQAAINLGANDPAGPATPNSAPPTFQPFSGSGNAAGTSPPSSEATQPPPQPTGPMATDVQLAPPQVQGEQAATREDTGLRFLESQLLANDSTPYTPHPSYGPVPLGETGLRITSVFAPEHGNVWLQANALGGTEVVFVPEANYNGPASFQYTVTDSYGLCSNAGVSLNIGAVNDAPTVLGETAAGDEDTTLLFTTGSLLTNDADIDNPQTDLRIVSVDNAVHGAVSLQADGTIRFVPEADYFGPAQFTYTVGDGAGGFTVGLASLSIAPVNDAP